MSVIVDDPNAPLPSRPRQYRGRGGLMVCTLIAALVLIVLGVGAGTFLALAG